MISLTTISHSVESEIQHLVTEAVSLYDFILKKILYTKTLPFSF